MPGSDPPIIITGGSAKLKLSDKFNGTSKHEFDSTVILRRVVIKDPSGAVVASYDLPAGAFRVEFHDDDSLQP